MGSYCFFSFFSRANWACTRVSASCVSQRKTPTRVQLITPEKESSCKPPSENLRLFFIIIIGKRFTLIIRFNKQRNREGEEEENGGNKTNASRVNSGKKIRSAELPQLQEKNIKKTNSPDKRKKKKKKDFPALVFICQLLLLAI